MSVGFPPLAAIVAFNQGLRMNQKEALIHDKLKNIKDSVEIPESDYIKVYGNNESRKIGGKVYDRPNIHADQYNLGLTKDGDIYTFWVK